MPNIVDDRGHDRLKALAGRMLKNRGFIIEYEKRFLGGKYIVDVYGERDGEVIMYECGGLYDGYESKLDWLRKHVGKVIHMPYLDQWIQKHYEPVSRQIMREYIERVPYEKRVGDYLEAVKRARGDI